MDTYYGYETALWYWRMAAPLRSEPRRITRSPQQDSYAHSSDQEHAHRPNWLDPTVVGYAGNTIHCLVFHRSRRATRGDSSIKWHLWHSVPRDAFVPAGEGSFVASPEFCFLQMANQLEFSQLVALGMELCGLYAIDPEREHGLGTRAMPLTTTTRLTAFLEENAGARGRRAALTAARYIADGSASPMETTMYLQLCLPVKRGGYGLPRPELNYRIDLNANARRLSGLGRCYGDLCWPAKLLDLEYLGREHHDGAINMLADRRRTLAIEEMGYEVIEVTKEQALEMAAFDIVAQRLAAKLGKRFRPDQLGATQERKRLFNALDEWHSLERFAPSEPEAPEKRDSFDTEWHDFNWSA